MSLSLTTEKSAAVPPRVPVTPEMGQALMVAGFAVSRSGLLTVEQYEYLHDAGLVAEKTELLSGEIVEKMSQNGPHIWGVRNATRAMCGLFGDSFVFSQTPVALSTDDAPEPDVFVTREPDLSYPDGRPSAADLRLVIEISASTLRYDLDDKAPRYAAAGIEEYWVVDVTDRLLRRHRNPSPQGYAEVVSLTELDGLSPIASPQNRVVVMDLLP